MSRRKPKQPGCVAGILTLIFLPLGILGKVLASPFMAHARIDEFAAWVADERARGKLSDKSDKSDKSGSPC